MSQSVNSQATEDERPIPLPEAPRNDRHSGPYIQPRDSLALTDSRYHTEEVIDPPWFDFVDASMWASEFTDGKCEVCGIDEESDEWITGCRIEHNDYQQSNHAFVCEQCRERGDWRRIVRERRRSKQTSIRRTLMRPARYVRDWFIDPNTSRFSVQVRRAAVAILLTVIASALTASVLVGTGVGVVSLIVHTIDWTRRDPTGWVTRWRNPSKWILAHGVGAGIGFYLVSTTTAQTLPMLLGGGINTQAEALSLGGTVFWMINAISLAATIDRSAKADSTLGHWSVNRLFWATSVRLSVAVGLIFVLIPIPTMATVQTSAGIISATAIVTALSITYGLLRIWHLGYLHRAAWSIYGFVNKIKHT